MIDCFLNKQLQLPNNRSINKGLFMPFIESFDPFLNWILGECLLYKLQGWHTPPCWCHTIRHGIALLGSGVSMNCITNVDFMLINEIWVSHPICVLLVLCNNNIFFYICTSCNGYLQAHYRDFTSLFITLLVISMPTTTLQFSNASYNNV